MNEKLSIQNLIELLAEKHGMDKKDAENFVKEFFQLIEESLESDKYVKIRGLGTFKLIDVDSRESVNINTGERFEIQGHTKVSFTPEPSLKELVNKPFSHFETVVLNDETVLEDTPIDGNLEEEEEKEEVALGEQISEMTVTEIPVSEMSVVAEEEPVESIEQPQPIEIAAESEKIEAVEEAPISTQVESVATVEVSPEAELPYVEPASKVTGLVSETPVEEKEEEEVPTYDLPDAPSTPVDTVERRSSINFFIGIVVLVVLLCVGAVTFMYYPNLLDGTPPTEEVGDGKTEKPTVPAALTDSLIQKDTTFVAKEDTVAGVAAQKPAIMQETSETMSKEKVRKSVAVPLEPDSVSYKIVGTKTTYTIKEGETLTRVALRFYGTKALWPYIVKHNPDVIKNPDNVPYGTVVKIPELVKK